MNLYIASIKLWFQGFLENEENAIIYRLKPDKINVITGDSSTGKSSILGVIDYCLLSDTPTIVENIINENVEYYGINIYLNGKSYILIRKAPHLGIGTQDVHWSEQKEYPIPYTPTHSVGEMKVLLSEMFQVPPHNEKVGRKNIPMSFRHFLPLNYLTEDIISSANTYFDTAFFVDKSFDSFLDFALEYANGIRCHNSREIEDEIQKTEKDLEKYREKHFRTQESERKYKEILISIYEQALQLNLIPPDSLFLREDAGELRRYIQHTISEYEQLIKNDEDTTKLERLKNRKDKIKATLNTYNSLLSEVKRHKNSGVKVQDSLRPIKYIKNHINEVVSSPDTIELLNLLEKQLIQIKEENLIQTKLPADFYSRYNELNNELVAIEERLRHFSTLRKTIANPKWVDQAVNIKYRLKDLKKPAPDTYLASFEQDKISRIEALNSQLAQIHLMPHDVKVELNKSINEYFQSPNGMVDSYPDSTMRYDDENRRISLLKNGEHYPIRNIGSKSNYMFLHLCFFLGIHKSIIAHGSKQVGSFLFIDQPSIPYYADKNVLDDDDKKQLMRAFRLLNDFMNEIVEKLGKTFQIILIEHADESYWKDLDFFHTAGKFYKSEDGGLIPKYIYEKI